MPHSPGRNSFRVAAGILSCVVDRAGPGMERIVSTGSDADSTAVPSSNRSGRTCIWYSVVGVLESNSCSGGAVLGGHRTTGKVSSPTRRSTSNRLDLGSPGQDRQYRSTIDRSEYPNPASGHETRSAPDCAGARQAGSHDMGAATLVHRGNTVGDGSWSPVHRRSVPSSPP